MFKILTAITFLAALGIGILVHDNYVLNKKREYFKRPKVVELMEFRDEVYGDREKKEELLMACEKQGVKSHEDHVKLRREMIAEYTGLGQAYILSNKEFDGDFNDLLDNVMPLTLVDKIELEEKPPPEKPPPE